MLFFVLSGFVIAYAYDDRLGSGCLRPKDFVLTRLIRFYPLYFAGLMLGLTCEIVLLAVHHPIALPLQTLAAASFSGLVFMPWPVASRNDALFPLNFPAWSLFYELAVNIVYAFMQRFLSIRVLISILFISGVALIAVIVRAGSTDVGPTINGVAAATVRTIFSFTFGLLIFRVRWQPKSLPVLVVLFGLGLAMAVPHLGGGGNAAYDIVFVLGISP
ncbi:MAG: acyltransferase, partial [Oxalobacteraceae bacterium]